MNVEIYRNQNGNEPFIEWLSAIKDKATVARIRSRLRRIEETGNLGDYRSVGGGAFEFRWATGPTLPKSGMMLFCYCGEVINLREVET